MNFRYKNYLQRAFSAMPKGEAVNYLFQRYVTRSLPFSNEKFLQKARQSKLHADKFHRYNTIADKDGSYYEFGAGWDLINPIALSMQGFKKLTCIDIRELIYPELVADTLKKLAANENALPFPIEDLSGLELDRDTVKDTLKNILGIDYRAPLDARATGMPDNSVDFIASNVTFEHIPQADIPPILTECYRILKPGGVMSSIIDYQDHWSYFDRTISVYNYLTYSEKEWRKYNPALHYQNRLRHKDYLEPMRAAGFDILEENPVLPTPQDLAALKNLTIDPFFCRYTLDELAIKGSHIVMRKP
jgi:SAM-dependent methyltransferase